VSRRFRGGTDAFGPSTSSRSQQGRNVLDQVAKVCGVRVSVHDLRRTVITTAESCDISPIALKALVNHGLCNDVTSGYVQINVERLRDPAQRVTDRLKQLCQLTDIRT
jgi:hypothetical protein